VIRESLREVHPSELAIRFTRDFFEQNKEFVVSLIKILDKPTLVEMWDEREMSGAVSSRL
jgi:hypothetical protein